MKPNILLTFLVLFVLHAKGQVIILADRAATTEVSVFDRPYEIDAISRRIIIDSDAPISDPWTLRNRITLIKKLINGATQFADINIRVDLMYYPSTGANPISLGFVNFTNADFSQTPDAESNYFANKFMVNRVELSRLSIASNVINGNIRIRVTNLPTAEIKDQTGFFNISNRKTLNYNIILGDTDYWRNTGSITWANLWRSRGSRTTIIRYEEEGFAEGSSVRYTGGHLLDSELAPVIGSPKDLYRLRLQQNGNLELSRTAGGQVLWSSNSGSALNPNYKYRLRYEDNGLLAIWRVNRSNNGLLEIVWRSFTGIPLNETNLMHMAAWRLRDNGEFMLTWPSTTGFMVGNVIATTGTAGGVVSRHQGSVQ